MTCFSGSLSGGKLAASRMAGYCHWLEPSFTANIVVDVLGDAHVLSESFCCRPKQSLKCLKHALMGGLKTRVGRPGGCVPFQCVPARYYMF